MDRSTLNAQILKFEADSKGPEQGSEDWFKLRKPGDLKRGRIGGSDMSTLLGKNPYKSRRKLMHIKQGYKEDTLPDKIYCWFGILFEEVAASIFEKNYNTTIHCKNISLIDSNLPYSIFSPDGICALPINPRSGGIQLRPCLDTDKFVPALVEIKCPLIRKLTTNNLVPGHYKPQIQTGLFCISMLVGAVFIDNIFRICSYTQLLEKYSFNRGLHRFDSEISDKKEEMHKGCILFYGKLPTEIDIKWVRKITINDHSIMDFGACSYTTVLQLLSKIRSNIFEVKYLEPDTYDIESYLGKKDELFGILPWKLFDTSVSLMYRDQEMIDDIADAMHKYAEGEFDIDLNAEKVKKVNSIKEVSSDSDNPIVEDVILTD